MVDFKNFTIDTINFITNLKANNDRDWFAKNKDQYEKFYVKPAKEFAAMMTEKISYITGQEMEHKIFRIYRDVRFSKNKTPYNPHLRILFLPSISGMNSTTSPGFYFSLEDKELIFGGGIYEFSSNLLDSYRQAIMTNKEIKALTTICSSLLASDFYMHEPSLKRLPKGVDAQHPNKDFLLRKGITCWKKYKIKQATSDDLVTILLQDIQSLMPLYGWLQKLPQISQISQI